MSEKTSFTAQNGHKHMSVNANIQLKFCQYLHIRYYFTSLVTKTYQKSLLDIEIWLNCIVIFRSIVKPLLMRVVRLTTCILGIKS